MFRMSFYQKVVENAEEHFSICANAYVDIGLRTHPSFVRTHT